MFLFQNVYNASTTDTLIKFNMTLEHNPGPDEILFTTSSSIESSYRLYD